MPQLTGNQFHDVVIRDGFHGYCVKRLREALAAMIELAGGWPDGTGTGDRVLLKVNMLAAKHPARAITTHPAVVAAVASLLLDRGCRVDIGDSPGGAAKGVRRYWDRCGFSLVSRITGAGLVSFEGSGSKKVSVRGNEYDVALPIIEGYDCRINLSKFKTHAYTRLTNSMKNAFGIVPGFGKAMLHMRSPRPRDLAVHIVDLFQTAGFGLNVTDGILSMDGRGPGTDGRVRHEGFLALSKDGVSLDMVLAEMAGVPWEEVDYLREARKRGLGIPLKEISVHGSHRFEDFHIPGPSLLNHAPRWIGTIARLLLRRAPRTNDRCTGCGICARACPVEAVKIEKGRASMKRGQCIMCLCCHEMCPENAVEIKLPMGRG